MFKHKNGKYAQWKDEDFKYYIPDVYCKDITLIDYDKLWNAGIRFLTFDIDETIESTFAPRPSKAMQAHFSMLKSKGFTVVLVSNNSNSRARNFAEALDLEYGIGKAKKPTWKGFETVEKYGKSIIKGFTREQWAHIGNSIINDIEGGNTFGVTTCLVRNVEWLIQKVKVPGYRSDGKKIRSEMKRRHLWSKHHLYEENDQYYQLGEQSIYRYHR